MGQDEDQVIAAAVATLAGQDARVADDAEAALDWIVGEQGLALVTQERVQNFCWYELPLEWTIEPQAKPQVAEALARALDLLELRRYAGICRSSVTREILAAYEASAEHGRAAFRRAAAASGIIPPDLPDFEWGAAMGFLEASAWSRTAGLLELAVASREMVPGARGWRTRQEQLVRTYLGSPQAELLGQFPAQVILTERTEFWVDIRRSPSRRRMLAGLANRLLHPAQLPAQAATNPLPQLRWLLEQWNDGISITRTGNLNQKFVQQSADRFGWDLPRPPRTEGDLYDLYQLRQLVQRLRLSRRSGRMLTLTSPGRRLLAEPERLWRLTAAGLIEGNDFSVFTAELFLAQLLDGEPVPFGEIKATVGKAVDEEGFRENRTGEPPGDHDITWAIHRTSDLCRALGLLAGGGDCGDRSYSLTGTGKVTALEALRARATAPRATGRNGYLPPLFIKTVC
jgi:hypothetical protein